MTEKRFDVGNLKIQDNAPKGRVYLLDMQGGVNALCSLINGLNDKSNRLERENEQLKKVFRKLITSGYWDDDYLTEQDWNDLKRWIENVFEKVMWND